MNLHSLYLSNCTEKLFEAFKQRLFSSSHPLTKRIVVVPSAAMKSWLMFQMAQDPEIGISAGIEIGFVEPTINKLFSLLSARSESFLDLYIPSELEVALALEKVITALTIHYRLHGKVDRREWLPLLQYLGVEQGNEESDTSRVSKRIQALSSSLAKLFREYGTSGGGMIAEWTKAANCWQALLWQELEKIFFCWSYPAKILPTFQYDASVRFEDVQIHVFGLSFLAPLHHRFLQKISEHLPVSYYILSPCQKFWGDMLSDKESLRLKDYWNKQGANKASQEALEDILRDRNPLLANFGRLGREMTHQLESLDAQCEEAYVLSEQVLKMPVYQELVSDEIIFEKTDSPLTLLGAVQADITLLRNPEQEKILFEEYDGTIQIHAVPKKSREVQVIYDTVMSLIEKHSNDPDPIHPGDIFVMAPDMSDYMPYIRSVFEGPESTLAIQMMDMDVPSQSHLIQGFLHLLSLGHGRWEASSLLQLFDYAAFRSSHQFSDEDIEVIRKWIKEAGIYWGKDHIHRNEVFIRNYEDNPGCDSSRVGTWEHGFARLLEGLAISADRTDILEMKGEYIPLGSIEMSQSDLLGKVIHLIRSLQHDMEPLQNGTKLNLEEWTSYLICLYEAYFRPGIDDEDVEGDRSFRNCMEMFLKSATKLNDKYAFSTIHYHLTALLQTEISTYKESNLNAVRFSTLLPMRAVPAKVVVLMGLSDGRFPRADQTNTLNLLLENTTKDYYPTNVEFDRYIFLESVLSARKYLILSYVSQEPGESKSQPPSLLVKELMGYLDHSYRIKEDAYVVPSQCCFFQHPLIPFHRSYFMDTGRLKSYSKTNYLAALSHYHTEKIPRKAFLSEFYAPFSVQDDSKEEITIDLKDLVSYSKSPLKVYLNKELGIYINDEKDLVVQDEESLFLSHLNASSLSRQCLLENSPITLSFAEKTGKIPTGPFKEICIKKIKSDVRLYNENLKSVGIDIEKLFSIDLRECWLKPTFCKKEWQIPCIELQVSGQKVKIVGNLHDVSEKGLVLLKDFKSEHFLSVWPSCLILHYLIERDQLNIEPQAIFVKEKVRVKKIRTSNFQDTAAELLMKYVDYYLKVKVGPSPLTPDVVESILKGKNENLNDIFKDESGGLVQQFDQYVAWLGRNSPQVELPTFEYWEKIAQELFSEVFVDERKKKTSGSMGNMNDSI